MSRLSIARALNASGVMGATIGTAVSLIGLLGVIVTTSTACPESIGPARCSRAAGNAGLLGVYGLIGAGCAGGLLMAGKLTDPEA
jgi:hypothetical protein|tara:strand:- start:97 stop:351 length:255 start_codon:yes stop_codon:yes gene_type:complete